jgi:hypothetical protein
MLHSTTEVICACKIWSDRMRRCYMWRTRQPQVGDTAEEGEAPESRAQLRDADGVYYFGDPKLSHAHLAVEKYCEQYPLIPPEALHASSVQHPDVPEYRWLLHTRRVPVLGHAEDATGADAQTHKCADIGDKDASAFICERCSQNLCKAKPTIPKRALASRMWGGREHPARQLTRDLPALKLLLGRVRLIYYQLILNPRGAPEESQKGLQGNTILVAHPTSTQILAKLPPDTDEMVDAISVVFTSEKTSVKKARQLRVPCALYLRCAELQRSVSPYFAEVELDHEAAAKLLPEEDAELEEDAPQTIVENAHEMREAFAFRPNLAGPATAKDLSCSGAGGGADARGGG